ncbi:GntR family transcriptional regulator [Actinomadura algeriensis]|uniref:DNA-binding GntR family transcriptional regulator n=1 Tax=Actinomadura algeriensis TaxID=1679523 RepID=A0ABR9K3J3_9ACTN|nr:GntR family transcriptional regulator [Actinomadura algeriensis]MBE1537425.1 DNA-binding GntR family transcriptional regulator [Actinomadura algeriensis]
MSRLGELEPVPRKSTVELVSDELRAAIMYGSLEPGDQLGEAELAARLGISRGPLREAMQRLVQEGLLVSEPHRGLFVITLDEGDVADVYLARLAIERAAGKLIMERNRGEAVARLTDALEGLVEAARERDRVKMSDADQAFHEVLVSASGSQRLERMAHTLLVETRMCLNALQDTYPEPDDLVEEHRRIVDAIGDGEEERLLRLIEEHMTDSIERLRTDRKTA